MNTLQQGNALLRRFPSVSGLRSRSGRFVQTIKITFPGSAIYDTNLRLANYRYNYYPQGELTYRSR